MKRFHQVAVLGTFLLAAGPVWSAEDSEKIGVTTVEMKSLSFEPKTVEVPVGGSVVWANKAHSKHTATSDDEGKTFDTGEIKPDGTSKPVAFEKVGEFKYHCKVHGKTMSGTVVVK
jgi:plastocyanin